MNALREFAAEELNKLPHIDPFDDEARIVDRLMPLARAVHNRALGKAAKGILALAEGEEVVAEVHRHADGEACDESCDVYGKSVEPEKERPRRSRWAGLDLPMSWWSRVVMYLTLPVIILVVCLIGGAYHRALKEGE